MVGASWHCHRSAGFQTCRVAGFQTRRAVELSGLPIWKSATQQVWKPALHFCFIDPGDDLSAPSVGEKRARILGGQIAKPFVIPFAPIDDCAVGVDHRNEVRLAGNGILRWAITDLGIAVVPENGFAVAGDGRGFVGSGIAEDELGRMRNFGMGSPADDAAEDVDDGNGARPLRPGADGVRVRKGVSICVGARLISFNGVREFK